MTPDFGLAARDYATYRSGFPEPLFERLATFGIGRAGQRVVDLGTGTGALARGFARRGCAVVGIDRSQPLLDEARRLDAAAGVTVEYRRARAERTGLPAGLADVVAAGQCWHWFDRHAAAREAARLLAPDGRIVIAHFDWLPLRGNVVEATEALVVAHNRRWKHRGGTGVYGGWLRDLMENGYRDIASFSFDVEVEFTHDGWRGRMRASSGVAASLPPPRVAAFDAALATLLRRRFPEPVLRVPHRVFAVVALAPEAGVGGRGRAAVSGRPRRDRGRTGRT